MKRRGYFYVAFATTLNIILYALTFGRFIWLEARVRGGVFRNWGGTRVREVIKLLLDDNLAFAAQSSHDAQSIAGILSTDVHGTGRAWGFVSESVVSLKLIDGLGNIHNCLPSDDLFRAAIGGIGAVGIISEVVIQGVDRFNINQTVGDSFAINVDQTFVGQS